MQPTNYSIYQTIIQPTLFYQTAIKQTTNNLIQPPPNPPTNKFIKPQVIKPTIQSTQPTNSINQYPTNQPTNQLHTNQFIIPKKNIHSSNRQTSKQFKKPRSNQPTNTVIKPIYKTNQPTDSSY